MADFKRLLTFSVICFVVSLPFSIPHFQITNFLMYFIAGLGVISFVLKRERLAPRDFGLLIMVLFYIMHVVGTVNTDNSDQALFDLMKKIALIIFPIAFFLMPPFSKGEVRNVLWFFAISCVLTCLYCMIVALYRSVVGIDPEFAQYHDLSAFVNIKANYLAMYSCFALGILFQDLNFGSQPAVFARRVVNYSAIFILTIAIVLLASRIHLVIIIGSVFVIVLLKLKSRIGIAKAVGFASLMAIVVIAITLAVPRNRERIREALNADESRWGEKEIRGSIWQCAYQLIEQKPFFGHGTGDSRDALEACYTTNEFTWLFYWEGVRFNAHCQYLESAVELGLFGTLCLLVMFGFYTTKSIVHRNDLLLFLMIIVCFSALTESILERQKGILFFTFFAPFLIVNNSRGIETK